MTADIGALLDRLFPKREARGRFQAEAAPWVIVGLGNPGPEYEETRHNAGLWCIQELARRAHVKLERAGRLARLAQVDIEGQPAVLVAPRTFVNESGSAVKWALARYRAGPEKLIVALDELNLEPGAVRIRSTGSPGGHNGMKSIIVAISTEEFVRVRIGVGRPSSPERQVEHVLSPLSKADRALVDEAVKRAADAVAAVIRDGAEPAMNQFN